MPSPRSPPRSPPSPTLWLRPPTPTSLPPLPPTSPPQASRPPTLPSQSSRTSPPTEPRQSTDPSEPTRPSASQLFTRPELTPSRLSAKLSTPQSTLLARSQLLLSMLPQLLLLPQLLPLLVPMLLLQLLLPVTVMLLPQLLLLVTVMLVLSTELTLLPQLLLNKRLNNPAATISKYLSKVIGLCQWSTVSPPPTSPTSSRWTWWLLILSCWNTSNVLVMLLQYDITLSNIKTSGTYFVVMLNVLFVRYRRELFIK